MGLVAATCAIASVAILAAKLLLAWRLNVNWDEFFFLSHVHALARGDLNLFLQGAYAHAFTWITSTAGDEIDQIVRLRVLMWALLAASAALIYAVARFWTSRPAALLAVFAFLSTWPVLKHGASFRADSLLLPLTLAAIYFVLRSTNMARRHAVFAGACLGVSFVVSVKAVLLLPAFVLIAIVPDPARGGGAPTVESRLRMLAIALVVAALVASALLVLHAPYVVATAEGTGTFASRSLQATIFDMPFAPRGDYFLRLAAEDALYWLAMLAGLFVAVRNRFYAAAASMLALTPILFYRNAFPYYYPLMIAPPAILVAIATDRLLQWPRDAARFPASLAIAAACALLMWGAWDSLMALRFSSQESQRAVVSAVHRVFPEPVYYLDHSGMIASFPKVNYFMSTWGVDAYLRRGVDFMPEALAGKCPPLLLVDHPVLSPGTLLYRKLREADRRLLEDRYVDYWGPIRVAGAEFEVPPGAQVAVRVPCTGPYRLESDTPILIDGRLHVSGSVVELPGEREIQMEAADAARAPQHARLVWAAAREPPRALPPKPSLYDVL